MSKNLNPENNSALSQESINALMEQAGDAIKKSVPAQATEERVAELDAEESYNAKLNALSNELTDAMLAGNKERVAELTKESMKLMDEHRGETTSKLEGLKTKTLGFLKQNKKFLLSTGAVVALGVIVKIALGQPADEEESVKDCDDQLCDDCANHETVKTSEV